MKATLNYPFELNSQSADSGSLEILGISDIGTEPVFHAIWVLEFHDVIGVDLAMQAPIEFDEDEVPWNMHFGKYSGDPA